MFTVTDVTASAGTMPSGTGPLASATAESLAARARLSKAAVAPLPFTSRCHSDHVVQLEVLCVASSGRGCWDGVLARWMLAAGPHDAISGRVLLCWSGG